MAKTTVDPKAALRAEIRAARDALPAAARDELGARISARVLALDAWRDAGCVLLYLSFGSEFDTAPLVAAAVGGGKRLCLPRVDRERGTLDIHHVGDPARDTAPGAFGVREPRAECARAEPGAVDFVLAPGVAFTPRGERLGYGGGYYDRLLGTLRAPSVAAAFALQMREHIPVGGHDRRVDWVITEQTSYRAPLTA